VAGRTLRVSLEPAGEAAAFSPSGKILASTTHDQRVRLWDVATGRSLAEEPAQVGPLHAIAFAPDGATLAVGGEAGVQLWDVVTGPPHTLLRPRAVLEAWPVQSLTFSPNGRLLAAAGGHAKVWDVAGARELTVVRPADAGFISFAAFAPDGTMLALSEQDRSWRRLGGSVRLWDLRALLSPQAVAARARAAASDLLRAVRDGDAHGAAGAMATMGPHALAAIPVLTPGLKDQKADVRAATAVALGRIGPGAKAAVPALVQALKDDSPQVRQAASVGLMQIDPDAAGRSGRASQMTPAQPPVPVRRHGVTLYEGRAAEEWIEKLGESRIPNEIFGRPDSRKPIEALRAIGPAVAVPAALTLLAHQRWHVRTGAAMTFALFGADAKAAIPALIAVFRGKNELVQVCGAAADALVTIGKATGGPPSPDLLKALSDADGFVRVFAAQVVLGIDPGHPAAMSALRIVLRDARTPHTLAARDGRALSVALATLRSLGARAAPAVPELTDLVQSGQAAVAVPVLANIGPAAGAAVPVLIQAMKHGDVNGRRAVADALVAIRGPGGPVLPDLLGVLNDADPYTRVFAARVVARLDPANQPAMRVLTDTLEQPLSLDARGRPYRDAMLLAAAVDALKSLGPNAAPAVPELTEVLRSSLQSSYLGDKFRAREVAAVLGQIGPAARPAVPVLIEMLTNRDWVVGGDAARVFARIGPETLPEVIKALEEVLKTDASERPKVVLWALRGFGESAAPAVPAVTHALTHANANVRHAAAETLGAIGPQALTAIPALSRALNDEAPHVRQGAARALKRIQGAPESRAGE
jgi:HEAT repeat protein